MAYIKLGPNGDYFNSNKLGITLVEGNAAYVTDEVLYSTLYNFLLTGFFILIEKHEFDNIKVDRRAIRSIPLQYVGVNQHEYQEPVIDFINNPPEGASPGDRYIVGREPTGVWQGYRNTIVEYRDDAWQQIIPKEGLIIPIYNLGISTTYKGTNPSGDWDISDDRLSSLRGITNQSTPQTEQEYATRAWVIDQISLAYQGLNLTELDNRYLQIPQFTWENLEGKPEIPIIFFTAPVSPIAVGSKGEMRFTPTHIYYCVEQNTWVRVAVETTWGI